MKLKQLAAVIGLGLLGATATAQAYTVQAWDFQDDSIDFILRANTAGGFDVVTTGAVQQGDIFVGILEFTTASATYAGGGHSLIPPGMELTGVSVIQLVTQNPSTTPFWSFAPYTGGMNSILALAGHTGVVGGNAGGGAMAAMWLNSAPSGAEGSDPAKPGDRNLILDAADATYGNTTNCTSLVDCLTQASLGSLLQVDGMWGEDISDRYDRDNFWISQAILNPPAFAVPTYDTVKSGSKTTQFSSISAGLSNLFSVVEPVLFQKIVEGTECVGATHNPAASDGCVQVRMTGQILGGAGLKNGAVGRDDIDARKLVAVPEPATLGLLGLGLLGLGLMRRRLG
jgi:hypothetical protein